MGVFDWSQKRERMCVFFLGKIVHLVKHVWRPLLVLLQFFEYTCRKIFGLLVVFFTHYCSKCNKNLHLCKIGNLEVDQKPPSTMQIQHQLHACSLAGSLAKSKIQAEIRKKPIYLCERWHLGTFSLIEKVPKTKMITASLSAWFTLVELIRIKTSHATPLLEVVIKKQIELNSNIGRIEIEFHYHILFVV